MSVCPAFGRLLPTYSRCHRILSLSSTNRRVFSSLISLDRESHRCSVRRQGCQESCSIGLHESQYRSVSSSSTVQSHFLDGLEQEYEHLKQKVYGDASEDHSSIGQENMRLKRLHLALPKLQSRRELLHEIDELNKMVKDALGDEGIMRMAQDDIRKNEDKIEQLDEQILHILTVEESSDVMDLMLEVSAGIGGQEAMLFAAELFSMYEAYAAFRGWAFNALTIDRSDIGGIRSAEAEISGPGTFQSLTFEGGIHRVQRTPKTEKAGRIHTSTASVVILPKPTDVEVVLQKKDLRIETCRSSGKGGQNVNKLETSVRVVHIPTNTAVECQEERDQNQNKTRAMNRLAALLYQRQLDQQTEHQSSTRRLQAKQSARSDKIRTYNFAQDRITDHRINQNFHNVEDVLKGGEHLDNIIKQILLMHQRESHDEIIQSSGLNSTAKILANRR